MRHKLLECDNCGKQESGANGDRDFFKKWLHVRNGAAINDFDYCSKECAMADMDSVVYKEYAEDFKSS